MGDFRWKKRELLVKQLEFFGCKKTGFISEYAKKPRIRIKNKIEVSSVNSERATINGLYEQQIARGMQLSEFGYGAMAQAQYMQGLYSGIGGQQGSQGLQGHQANNARQSSQFGALGGIF